MVSWPLFSAMKTKKKHYFRLRFIPWEMLIFLWQNPQVAFSLVAGETLPAWLNNTTGYSRMNGVQMIVHFSALVVNRQKERRLKNDLKTGKSGEEDRGRLSLYCPVDLGTTLQRYKTRRST